MTKDEVVTGGEIKVRVTYKIEEKEIVNKNLGLGCSKKCLGERKGEGKRDRREYNT